MTDGRRGASWYRASRPSRSRFIGAPPLSDDGHPAVELVLDAICDGRGIVVLPRADHAPALRRQDRLVPCVALPVREELPSPQLGVRLRQLHVFLAVVPEAAVDEDRDPGAGEHEVGADAAAAAHLPVDEEAAAAAVQLAAECEFGCGVTAAEAGHVAAAGVVGFPLFHRATVARASRRRVRRDRPVERSRRRSLCAGEWSTGPFPWKTGAVRLPSAA